MEFKFFVKKVWWRENSLFGFYNQFFLFKFSNYVWKYKDIEKKYDFLLFLGFFFDKLEMIIGSGFNENGVICLFGGFYLF